MVSDPKYKFLDFEDELNSAGYDLLGDNQTDGTIFVFQFVTQLFPNSANTWDSLAEAYLKSGNKEKAKDYYNKALKLDPDGPTGANARNMLKSIDN